MKSEPVLTLMSSLDPALIEEADLALPAKRRLPKAARAGLIAACLCLALAGTAAAGVAMGWIRVTAPSVTELPHRNGGTVTITEFEVAKDGSVYILLENISQEARDYANSFLSLPQYKNFDSWAEAEEFLGVHLADNPVLDGATLWTQPATPDFTSELPGIGSSGRANKEPANCAVCFRGRTDSPDSISLYSVYELEDTTGSPFHLAVDASIYTAPFGDKAIPHQYVNQEVATENYVTPSGLQTVIITVYDPEYDTTAFYSYFTLNGAYYTLLGLYWGEADVDQAVVPVIKEVLDAYS